ncbi:MAG: hypothetical protein AB1423_14445 [Pseudomonadota bacterium]
MADVFTRKGFDGTGWNIAFADTDYLAPMGASFGDGVSVGGFQDSNHKTDSGMTTDGCDPDHVRNCKYISPTQVSLMGGAAVTLNETNVAETDCSLRWSYADDTPVNTALSNVLLFAFDGVTPADPPVGCKVLAFERTAAAILKDRVSDTPGDGGAWDSSKGIGGSGNALICSTRTSVAVHYFYFGLSVSPTSKGQKNAALRLEFDAQ